MNIKFAVRVLGVLLMLSKLSYAQQEQVGKEVSADAHLINYIINKYASEDLKKMELIANSIQLQIEFNKSRPYAMFLRDCFLNKALSETIANLRSNDQDKKQHAQKTMIYMQQEFKKRMALWSQRHQELVAHEDYYTKGGFVGLFGCLGFMVGAFKANEKQQDNLAIFLGINSLCSFVVCLVSLGKSISFTSEKVLVSQSCNEMEKVYRTLEEILVH